MSLLAEGLQALLLELHLGRLWGEGVGFGLRVWVRVRLRVWVRVWVRVRVRVRMRVRAHLNTRNPQLRPNSR